MEEEFNIIESVNIKYNVNKINGSINTTDFLNVLSLNVQSIRNKFNEIKNLIASYDFTVHVIVLSEIFIYSQEQDRYIINNYNSYFLCRDGNRGGGVVVYVLKTITSNKSFELNFMDNSFLNINFSCFKFNLLAIYRPPSSDKSEFLNKLEEILANNNKTYIVGDLNLDLLKPNDSAIQKYLDILNSYGYLTLNKTSQHHATRIQNINNRTSRTIIDHIATNIFNLNYYLSVHDFFKSDHRIVLFNIKLQNVPSSIIKTTKTVLQYEKINFDQLSNEILSAGNFDELIQSCKNIIINNTKTTNIENNLNKKKPWITNEIKQNSKTRDKFYKLKIKYPDNNFFSQQFKYYKKLTFFNEKESQKKYFVNALSNNDFRHVWCLMNEHVLNKTKQKPKIILEINNITIDNPNEVCSKFNNHFINCIDSNIIQNTNRLYNSDQYFNLYNITTPYEFYPTNSFEVHKTIELLNKKSAVGYDNISTKFCNYIKEPLCHIIAKLINKCIIDGKFPQNLKIAKVTPIFKNGNNMHVNNYRPISVITTFSKIFEKIMYQRLENHLIVNKVINQSQFGFCVGSSTLAATSELVTNIKSNLDLGFITACIFIDLKKAFDSVNHKILVNKICGLSITNTNLKLIESYLQNRKQFVKIDNGQSEEQNIRHGVPQGSLLGPLFFNFFINDIFLLDLFGSMIMYADDISVTYKSKSVEDLQNQMRTDVKKINSWMETNLLKINETKTKYIIFETRNKKIDVTSCVVSLNGHIIEQVSYFKYLGLWIDKRLNWEHHISTIKDKIRKTNFILYQMKHILPAKAKFMIFHSHIMSSVRYLLPIWGTASCTRLTEIHRLLNKSLKTIKNLPLLTPSHLLYDQNIISLQQLTNFEIILLIYKIKSGLIKHNFFLRSIESVHSYNTRHRQANNFYIDNCRTSGGQNGIVFKGLSLFNGLPDDIKNEQRISRFKIILKEFLTTNSI